MGLNSMDSSGAGSSGETLADTSLARRLALGRFRARLSLLAEQAMPILLLPLSILSLFLSAAWLGFFRTLPDGLRWAILFGLTFSFLLSLLPLRALRWPGREEADRRLETVNGLAHQAISALEDRPVTDTPFAHALFERHRARLAASIGPLAAGLPEPDISRFDAMGVRAIPALAFLIAFSFSFSGTAGRVSDAFRNRPVDIHQAGLRVDVWVTPPGYTARPAITLSEGAKTDPVPQFSVLTVRVSGGNIEGPVQFTPAGGTPVDLKATLPAQGEQQKASNFNLKLETDGILEAGGRQFPIALIPDEAPRIDFDGKPRRSVNGALEVRFKASDDYGLKNARLDIVAVDQPKEALALFPLPEFPLDLPRREGRNYKGVSSKNLTEHPLSGKRVRVTLVAEDGAGQTGRSPALDMVMPARAFVEPLAAAVAEQRQIFALDVRDLGKAIDFNDAVTLRGDEAIANPTHFLLLKSARTRMALSRNEAMLKDAAAYLWDIALGIDGGDLPVAEKAVRDAQKALADALKRNAPDNEIKSLMDNLRKAMQDYMAALSKRMQQMKPGEQSGEARNVIRQQDLERMMDQLENMARSGNRQAAEQLLSDMQRLMNNLQAGTPQRPPSEAESKAREQVDKLGKLLRDQQKLMEETYKLNQEIQKDQWQTEPATPPDGSEQEGMMPESGDQQPGSKEQRQAMRELQKRQQDLQKQLQELGQGLKSLGMKPGKGFGEAGKQMEGAGKALGRGEGEPAVEGQGKAVEALRQGAREMMQAMSGKGQGQGGNQPGQGPGQQSGRDPLGRSRGDGDLGESSDGKVPDEIDVQRAREILNQIRRKLGESSIAPSGRQYLERLLNLN